MLFNSFGRLSPKSLCVANLSPLTLRFDIEDIPRRAVENRAYFLQSLETNAFDLSRFEEGNVLLGDSDPFRQIAGVHLAFGQHDIEAHDNRVPLRERLNKSQQGQADNDPVLFQVKGTKARLDCNFLCFFRRALFEPRFQERSKRIFVERPSDVNASWRFFRG